MILPFLFSIDAGIKFDSCCSDDAALLRYGLLNYTAKPVIRDTTAIAIINALILSLFIINQNPLSKLIT
jgi:hypothetical protein